MKRLQDKFQFAGWDYSIIERTEKHFIFEKSAQFATRIGYEVFQRRISPAGKFVRDGVEIETEEKEMFPKDEHFGKWAWSGLSIDDARKIADKIALHQSVKNV